MSKLKELEYETIIRNDDPIVRDHRVHEVRIMPGVTFVSLIYNVLEEEGLETSQYVLKDILFQEAITTTEEYERKLKINISDVNGVMKAGVFSKRVKNDKCLDTEWIKHFECSIFYEQLTQIKKKINIEALKEDALYCDDMDSAYYHARNFDIRHYDFMKSRGKLFRNQEWIMAEIYLGNLAMEYLPSFLVHPVYLDSATLLPAFYSFKNPEYYNLDFCEPRPSIPISINSFKLYERLDEICYVYVRKDDIKIYSDDIMYANIEIYNKAGELVSLINKLAYKKIRSSELITNINPMDDLIKKEIHQNTSINKQILKNEFFSTPSAVKNLDIKSLVEEDLKKIVAQIFEKSYTNILIDEGFYDMGLDSGDLLKFVRILEKKVSKQLYPTLLFEYTNIEKLSAYIAENYGDCYSFEVQNHHEAVYNEALSYDLLYYSSELLEKELESSRNNLSKDCPTILITDDIKLKNEFEEKLESKRVTIIWQEPGYESDEGDIIKLNKLEDSINNIANEIEGVKVIRVIFKLDSAEKRKSLYVLFNFTKLAIKANLKCELHIVYLFNDNNDKETIYSKALVGFARSVQLENPNFYYRIIGIDKQESRNKKSELASLILGELSCMRVPDTEVCYNNKKRYVLRNIRYSALESMDKQTVLRNQGVYVITGGMGGLGIIIAKHLLENYQAKVILAGRTPINEDIKAKMAKMNALGGDVCYIQADISSEEVVKELVKEVKRLFGAINGIIHCAGITLDAYVINKNQDTIEQVLSPKIQGCMNIDNAMAEEPLDFFLLFSSLSAVTGNAGQSDYAYANNFLCKFAQYREELQKIGNRYGKTIAINWPLWEVGGMKVSSETVSAMKKQLGIAPLCSKDGLIAFDTILKSGKAQMTVVYGDLKTMEKSLNLHSFDNKESISKVITHNENNNDEINEFAIIGIDVKFPKAPNLESFWENLKNGRDCIEEIPKDRWDWQEYFTTEKKKGVYSKWGGFIEDMQYFDAEFFGISREEAVFMDPQERIFLETVWHVLEDAGYTRKDINKERVGVFVGAMYSQYQLIGTNMTKGGTENVSGAGLSSIANRTSYYMDFKGPSIVVDTACSSSLEAIKLACNFMRLKECELAIAGGVNLTIHPSKYQLLCQAEYLSSNGECRCFGAGGDGYVPGEGVGAILLKPLARAITDGDYIYGVVKGIETNHVGKSNGYSVPNPQIEADLIIETLSKAKIDASTISYVEAHSTGTEIGDLIEIMGLKKAFERHTGEKQFCAIGSVKSNIGHLEAAAGMASLAKVLLQMKYKILVPSIHCYPINPSINFQESPFYIGNTLLNWEQKKSEVTQELIPRRAGISAFGAGGSNVHMIIEEFNKSIQKKEYSIPIFVLSAKTEVALYAYAKQMLDFFRSMQKGTDNKFNFNSALYTLQVGREAMEYRVAFIADRIEKAITSLENFTNKNYSDGIYASRITKAKLNAGISHDLQYLFHEKQYGKLMKLWSQGQLIEWDVLYQQKERISMPNYPFQRECFWPSSGNINSQGDTIEFIKEKELSNDLLLETLHQVYIGELDEASAIVLLEEII